MGGEVVKGSEHANKNGHFTMGWGCGAMKGSGHTNKNGASGMASEGF